MNSKWCLLLLLATCWIANAQIGEFEGQNDVGTVSHEGSGSYDASAKTYTLTGSGENIWSTADHFHFVWKKLSSDDLGLAADISLTGANGDPHRKAVLMVRQSLDPDSPYADVAVHGNGLASLQYRETKGAATREIQSAVSNPKRVRIEKRGNRFYLWVGNDRGSMSFSGGSAQVVLTGPFYVGLGVCAHNKDAVQSASFSDVDVSTAPPIPGTKPETFSTIQTITVASADARASFVSHDHLTAPSWGNDGTSILFADGDKTEQVGAAGGPAQPSETELDTFYGQDRSPDGRYIYMSSNRSGTYQIWRTSSDGSNPEQLTHDETTNNTSPHLSPDGQQVIFVSYPSRFLILPDNTDITLKVMSLTDKKARVLADFVGGRDSLGSHPWSPDGKQATFVSYQSIVP